ncbi:MAG: Ig-like domain-containing protein [Candidatus Cloacimonetes bacterium]|nr:Ig-like domain-containing protein [Candidatus Cloacimonadota bacterium]
MKNKLTLIAIIYIAILLVFMSGCGSRKSPTGGPQDVDKPTVLASLPAEYGDISKGTIEISFSKEMDKGSLANSIYIYPPVEKRKISLDGATLKIKLNEALKQDTNYFVTLTTRLKDVRGNALAKNQTLIFSSGNLLDNRIMGAITYEDKSDMGLPIELSLFSPDSLLVLSTELRGGIYILGNLNPQKHTLRAFIDKNLNNRYDFGADPYFEGSSDGAKVATIDLQMAYADSSMPRIKKIVQLSNRELSVELSEAIKGFREIKISGTDSPKLVHKILEEDKISILCAPLDSTEYTLELSGAEDKKGNVAEELKLKFRFTAAADTLAPRISYTLPRNGASVNSLSPILELHFSEIIPEENIAVKLFMGSREVPIKQLSGTGRIHRFQATEELDNYKAYILKVLPSTSDFSGNKLKEAFELNFLPLKRN